MVGEFDKLLLVEAISHESFTKDFPEKLLLFWRRFWKEEILGIFSLNFSELLSKASEPKEPKIERWVAKI